MEVNIDEEKTQNGWVVVNAGNRIDLKNSDAIYERMEEIIKREEKVVLDMAKVEYLSSAGLRVFLRLKKLANKDGREFTIAGASGVVKNILKESGIDTLLEAKESLSEIL